MYVSEVNDNLAQGVHQHYHESISFGTRALKGRYCWNYFQLAEQQEVTYYTGCYSRQQKV